METIKIQINHKEPLTLSKLATILYDEIEDYFNFLSSFILPNETFITDVTHFRKTFIFGR